MGTVAPGTRRSAFPISIEAPREVGDELTAAAVAAPPAIAPTRPGHVPVIVVSTSEPASRAADLVDTIPPGRPTRHPTVSVIIPTLNEALNLPHVLPGIPDEHEVIIVDGRSTDATVDVARQLRPSVRIVHETTPGKGAALRAGFLAATGDIIVMLDADGSADPTEIPRFVDALVAGADFAKGSRFVQGGGSADITLLRSLGNKGFTLLVRILFGGRFTDLCYGYNAFWRSVGPQLELDVDGFEIETLMNITALRCGLEICEVASFESRRIHGSSNLRTFRDGWRVLRTILRERVAASTVGRRPDVLGSDRSRTQPKELIPVMMDVARQSHRDEG